MSACGSALSGKPGCEAAGPEVPALPLVVVAWGDKNVPAPCGFRWGKTCRLAEVSLSGKPACEAAGLEVSALPPIERSPVAGLEVPALPPKNVPAPFGIGEGGWVG